MKLPTLSDVAKQAGVSYATADRVVNRRGRVSEKAAEKVRAAVAELRYVRNVAAANLSQQRVYRFVFVLPSGRNAFFQRVRGILAERATQFSGARVQIDVEEVPAFDAAGLAAHLDRLAAQRLDGLAVVGLDDPMLAAPIARLQDAGVPVVSLVSDLSADQRATFVGIDNLAAGRTAARLLGFAHNGAAGAVQLVVGDLSARDHRDRVAGFTAVMRTDFPQIDLRPVIEGRDHAATVEADVGRALTDTAAITAIYSVGAGNSGLLPVLSSRPARPLVVVHELVSHSRQALEQGVFDYVIDQRPDEEVDAAIAYLRALVDDTPLPLHAPILPTIYLRDNLPPTKDDAS